MTPVKLNLPLDRDSFLVFLKKKKKSFPPKKQNKMKSCSWRKMETLFNFESKQIVSFWKESNFFFSFGHETYNATQQRKKTEIILFSIFSTVVSIWEARFSGKYFTLLKTNKQTKNHCVVENDSFKAHKSFF